MGSGRVTRRRSKTTPRVKNGRVQRKNHRDVSWGEAGPVEIRLDVPGLGYRHVLTREHLERFIALIPGWDEVSRGLHEIILAEGSATTDGWYRDGVVALTAWDDPMPLTVGPQYYAAHREIWERLGVPRRPAPEFIAVVDAVIEPGSATLNGVERALERYFETYRVEICPGEGEREWIAIDRDETPGVVLAELTQIEHQVHMYERCMFMRFDRRTAAAYQLLHVFLHEVGHHLDAMALPHRGCIVRGEDYAEDWAIRTAETIWDETMATLR